MSNKYSREKERVRILVIDENPQYHEDLSDHASFYPGDVDFESRFTSSDTEAHKLLASWRPTVVLLGMHVPGVDSMELLKMCCNDVTPVIVTSDERSLDIEESARQRGAAGYVVKSQEPEHLEEVLQGIARFSSVAEQVH